MSGGMGGRVLISSGEASGDLHGSNLIDALRKLDPDVKVTGMGGHAMIEAGLDGLDSTELAVVGIVEVIGKLSLIRKAFYRLVDMLDRERPDCVVLIDYPEFNLRFAKEAKKRSIPVVYYISPQVWAWRKGRVRKIARLVDKMLVVFPFEAPFYDKVGLDVEYVGHPLVDEARCDLTKEEARAAIGVEAGARVIAVLPGSRAGEVRRLLPDMAGAVELVQDRLGESVTVVLPAARSVDRRLIDGILADFSIDIKVVDGKMYEVLRASDVALVASGTATLETALIGTPMVIGYRIAFLSYIIGRALVSLDAVGLPNIVAEKLIVPEFLQWRVTAENLAEELHAILIDDERRAAMVRDFAEVREKLGDGGASDKAAAAVYKMVSSAGRPAAMVEREL